MVTERQLTIVVLLESFKSGGGAQRGATKGKLCFSCAPTMDLFRLIKHRRGDGGAPTIVGPSHARISPAALRPSTDDDDDSGPFFDLDFSVDGDEDDGLARDSDATSAGSADHVEVSRERGVRSDSVHSLYTKSEPRSKPALEPKPATKLRVLMLGFDKPKSSKMFVKLKLEEVPIGSLFTRDKRSRSSGSSVRSTKLHADEPLPAESESKRFSSKDALQRYLSKIKPLYVRVSKRYGDKLRFSGQLSSGTVDEGARQSPAPAKSESNGSKCQKANGSGSLPLGLKVVCRRLGKSRSASSVVASVRSPPEPIPRRRDDSLLEQQDGIQSAIAHCKRSFNSSRESESESTLVRSRSDPGEDRSMG